jgi:hypothetical protein
MQNLNMRKNCRRFSAQINQTINCTPKSQRLRCCGRVLSEQELFMKEQGRGKGMKSNKGRGMGMNQGKGCGQGLANGQDQLIINDHPQQK